MRTQDLRQALLALIYRRENEYETISWAHMIDNFSLFSGQINNLMKIIKNEKTLSLRNRVLLPLALSPDVDEELAKQSEGRVQAFNHEMVPDYLRTKPEPDIEEKERLINVRTTSITTDQATRQTTMANKIVTNMIEIIKNTRDEWETESRSANQTQTSSLSDTNTLVAAINNGKGIKPLSVSPKVANSQMIPMQQMTPQVATPARASGGKAQPTIKTNIKAATAMHPYR
jgi:mediator of RNA polymerase II transcription subunit 8